MFIDQTTVQLIHKTIGKTGWIELPAEGTSMYPLIKTGDLCRFRACDPDTLKRADVALFYTESGKLVAHRFYYKQVSDQNIVFLFKGDTNLGFDEPICGEQIIGKLTVIKRGKKEINVGKPTSILWGQLIMTIPIMSDLLQRYLRRKSYLQSGAS